MVHLIGRCGSALREPIKVRLQLFAQERTESATPRRRQDARRKGQVAKTAELGTALILLSVFVALYFLASYITREVRVYTVYVYEELLLTSSVTEPGQIPALL